MDHHHLRTFLLAVILTTSDATNADHSFILSCGATADANDANGRKWSPDAKFLTSPNATLTATAQFQHPSLPSTVPYMTARILHSKTSYAFPVSTHRRHFIRLHFYPSSYGNRPAQNSFFSVSSCGFTLLKNFSSFLAVQALTQSYIVREFFMTRQDSGVLDLVFVPSSEDSFAFINGIEIMPAPDIFHPTSVVGFSGQHVDVESVALQSMFRVNVGGPFVSGKNDSGGMHRAWYDDSPYIYGAGFGIVTVASKNVTVSYPSSESGIFASVEVYRTARSMGPNAWVNLNYNLTWIFDVDANFTYLVRLHFCEYKLNRTNQMVFIIYVNNRTVERKADIIRWSRCKGIPVYKDYATYVDDDELWVALHPNVEAKPEFYNASLNGLEIFKLNDSNGNLAGLIPKPRPVKAETEVHHRGFRLRSKSGVIVGSVLGAIAGLSVIAVHVFHLNRRKRMRNDESHDNSSASKNLKFYRHFSLGEICLATDNFNEGRVQGVGGFGKVYKGFIDKDAVPIAIKRANPSSEQGFHELLNEIELLSGLRHHHLVSLIGACEENDEMILVYDYIPNGTLRDHLLKIGGNPYLTWLQRLGICIGASRGIHYLHTGAKHPIIHGDVKSTNILLDENWVAKVSDFGLSKTRHSTNQTHVSTIAKGSLGYMDPEYFRTQQLTEKSDVYSFGVVLFEVLCGKLVLNPDLPKLEASLAEWASRNYESDSLENIVDPDVRGEIKSECLRHFAEMAVKCLSERGRDRPSMETVLWNLEYCLQQQSNTEKGITAI